MQSLLCMLWKLEWLSLSQKKSKKRIANIMRKCMMLAIRFLLMGQIRRETVHLRFLFLKNNKRLSTKLI